MSASQLLQTPIEYLKGVGPQRAELLKKEISVFTYFDLLYYFPFRYVDRSKFYRISEIDPNLPYIQVKGFVRNIEVAGDKGRQRLMADFVDDTGVIRLVWFQGVKWIRESLKPGVEYVMFGKPDVFNSKINIVHPELEPVSIQNTVQAASLQSIYSATEKLKSRSLDSKGILKLIKQLLSDLPPMHETLPDYVVQQHGFLDYNTSIRQLHLPTDLKLLERARLRLKFEELFLIQIRILKAKTQRTIEVHGHRFSSIGEHFNTFFKEHLPFELTGAQKRVLKEIRADVGSGKQMNRLVQGDVGSGKTLVALMTMLMSLDNGMQACMMAPTEILAQQHYETISKLLEKMNLRVALLTGSTKGKERKALLADLLEGNIDILIGTHALIEDKVVFKQLGMVVIDEQHRFGVEQRSKLWKKNQVMPHVLVMTATPIPRTLAMTLYGDLDVSVIDELPPGRKPITTWHKYDAHRIWTFGFMKDQIEKGRQVYVVFPLIKESEKMDYKDLMDGFESISRSFPLPKYQVSIVHGQLKNSEKEYEMDRFVKGQTHIMIATTVIEVGVNVPNASVMVIESAERFGLSQLHQLRGRVGRGAEQSYCILMTGNKLSNESKKRMETMVMTNDGFEIAETDLRLRGPGDLAGTQQSGVMDLKLADLAKDAPIVTMARQTAMAIINEDPQFILPKNKILFHQFTQKQSVTNWSRIS